MPEGYKRSWGSVSKNFSPSRGFTSETKRMSKEAEDVYKKAMDQLKTKQEVYNLQTAQAKVTAQTDASTSKYEMASLTNFSKSLKTFLSTTAKDIGVENEKKDLEKWREKWKTHDADVIARRAEIEKRIAEIGDNTAEVALNVEKLKELKMFDELDPLKMSGNEQFAYYEAKAGNIVQNAELGYENYKRDLRNSNTQIPATWKGTYFNSATGKKEYELVNVKDITDPRGHRVLSEMYLNNVLDDPDNKFGGLKADLRTHILTNPLETKLAGIVDKNFLAFNKDVKRNIGESNWLALTNRVKGLPGSENISLIDSEIASILAYNGNNATDLGHHNGRTGVIQKFNTIKTNLINGAKTYSELETVAANLRYMFSTAKIKHGPNKGKTLIEAHGVTLNDDAMLTNLTKDVAARHRLIKEEQAETEVGLATGGLNTKMDQIASDHLSRQKNGMSEQKSKEIAEQETETMFSEALEAAETSEAKTYINSMRGDTRLLFSEADWLEHGKLLAGKWNGVIPSAELKGMSEEVRTKLEEKWEIQILDEVPGGTNKEQIGITDRNVKFLQNQLKQVEKELTNNTLGSTDSEVMYDLANDWYHKRLQYYMLQADPPLKHLQASNTARAEVSYMIQQGRAGITELADGPLKGMRNPFAATRPQDAITNNVWEKNEETQAHRERGQRLITLPERHYINIENASERQSDKPGGLNLQTDYIFAPLNKEAIAEGDLTSVKHLGITVNDEKETMNHIVMQALWKLGLKATGPSAADFLAKQREAAIWATGGLKSPLLQNDTILQAWFQGDPKEIKDKLLKEQKARDRDRSVNNLLSGWG